MLLEQSVYLASDREDVYSNHRTWGIKVESRSISISPKGLQKVQSSFYHFRKEESLNYVQLSNIIQLSLYKKKVF